MRILWVPHVPLRHGRTRSDHLIENLSSKHDVRVLSFHVHSSTRIWRYFADLLLHRTRHGTVFTEIALWRFPKVCWINGLILNRVIHRELSTNSYDVLVVAPAPYLVGFVDFARHRRYVPILCDFLDGGDWSSGQDPHGVERYYVRSSDAVICVSHRLTEQAKALNARSFYIPNGVEVSRFLSFKSAHMPSECKIELGIDPAAFVVSIIGLTCSPSLYFVDSVLHMARHGINIVLLLVGESPLLPEIRHKSRGWEKVVRIVGAIPYEDIRRFFMASDVGLNVVDDDPYYHSQSPLKIFEYTAMGKPVIVAPRLDEVVHMNLPNVFFCEPNADSLTRELNLLRSRRHFPIDVCLDQYDWRNLTMRVEEIILSIIKERGPEPLESR